MLKPMGKHVLASAVKSACFAWFCTLFRQFLTFCLALASYWIYGKNSSLYHHTSMSELERLAKLAKTEEICNVREKHCKLVCCIELFQSNKWANRKSIIRGFTNSKKIGGTIKTVPKTWETTTQYETILPFLQWKISLEKVHFNWFKWTYELNYSPNNKHFK